MDLTEITKLETEYGDQKDKNALRHSDGEQNPKIQS